MIIVAHDSPAGLSPGDSLFLTATKVSRLFGVKRHTVAGWIERGEMPGHKLGRRWFIPRAFIDELAAVPTHTEPHSATP